MQSGGIKKNLKGFLLIGFLVVTVFAGNVFCAQKVVIALGVTENYFTSGGAFVLCLDAVKEVLEAEKIPYEIIYSEIDEATDEAIRMERGMALAEKIRQSGPAVIISLGDYTTRYMVQNINDISIVAAFFFSPPDTLGIPNANTTGVVRGSYAGDIWRMAGQLTGAKTVGMLSRHSFAMEGVKKVIMARADALEKETGVRLTDMYLCTDFEDWKNRIDNWGEDLVYIIDSSRVQDGEKVMNSEEIVRWTVENAKVPVVATNEMDTRFGAMFSIVVSESVWGHQAAQLAMKILSGVPVARLPMESVKEGNLLINAKTVQKYKIEIPYEILESADHIYE